MIPERIMPCFDIWNWNPWNLVRIRALVDFKAQNPTKIGYAILANKGQGNCSKNELGLRSNPRRFDEISAQFIGCKLCSVRRLFARAQHSFRPLKVQENPFNDLNCGIIYSFYRFLFLCHVIMAKKQEIKSLFNIYWGWQDYKFWFNAMARTMVLLLL